MWLMDISIRIKTIMGAPTTRLRVRLIRAAGYSPTSGFCIPTSVTRRAWQQGNPAYTQALYWRAGLIDPSVSLGDGLEFRGPSRLTERLWLSSSRNRWTVTRLHTSALCISTQLRPDRLPTETFRFLPYFIHSSAPCSLGIILAPPHYLNARESRKVRHQNAGSGTRAR